MIGLLLPLSGDEKGVELIAGALQLAGKNMGVAAQVIGATSGCQRTFGAFLVVVADGERLRSESPVGGEQLAHPLIELGDVARDHHRVLDFD